MELCPELENIRKQSDANNARIRQLCAGLAEQQLAWRPGPNSWCIAEVLLHLERTTHIFLPIIDQVIEEARRGGCLSNGPFHLGLMGKFYVWYVEPPPHIRLPSPKPLVPSLEEPASNALPRFLSSQEEMKQRLEHANGIDLVRTRITSPFASFVKMDLLTLFSVGAAHERRHIWQISNVLAGLPSRSSL